MIEQMRLVPRTLARGAATLALIAASVFSVQQAARADEGMWLVNNPPTELLRQRYAFTPTGEWLERIQKSCTRILSGGSGSIVSPHGLVLTNHHVAFDQLIKLSTEQRDIVADGYLARSPDEELKCPDLEIQVLQSIKDVTDVVNSAVDEGMTSAEAGDARRSKIAEIEKTSKERTGLTSQVVKLYGGARYHLYLYKSYTDVRLVFAPDSRTAAFGGDIDNFEYPRWCLDCTFFRIYENGEPARCEHYLPFDPTGSEAGDLVFVFGHPGSTQRLNTVAHLEFLRDVDYPNQLRQIWRREVQLRTFSDRNAHNERIAKEDLLGFQNSRKAYTGFLAGLRDPQIMRRKVEAEKRLRAAARAHREHGAEWAGAWDKVARSYERFEEFYTDWLLTIRRPFMYSALWDKAHTIVQLVEELPKPNGERLPAYRDSALDTLYLGLYSEAPIHEALEINRIESALNAFADIKGFDDPLVQKMMAGKSPARRAVELVKGSRLFEPEYRRRLVEGGRSAVQRSDDPMIAFARDLDGYVRGIEQRYRDEVESPTRDAYADIVAARFEIEGENTYPDATFTLRMSFGTVKGYEEPGGGTVPPFTTIAGLYERYERRGPQEPFSLPEVWLQRRDRVDMSTPYNLVSTNDIIGGNSGSPLVNTEGEVVGLIFDGNIQSLVWGTQFDDRVARAVSVDVRGMIEAMDKIYDADHLLEELLNH